MSTAHDTAATVQSTGRPTHDVPRRRGESLAVLAGFTVVYAAVGHWLVSEQQVVGFETLDRWFRALTVWHDGPAALASVGVDYPPLSVLALTPLTLVAGPAASLALVPLGSAVFAGATMAALNTLLRRALLGLPARAAVLVALGLNPLVVLHAATGGRPFVWLALAVTALGCVVAWYVTADVRFVVLAGLAFGVAALAGYGSLLWLAVATVMLAAVLARLGASAREVEGTLVGLASPAAYAVALWTALNLVVLLRPFAWVGDGHDLGGTAGAPVAPASRSLHDLALDTGSLLLHGAPLALVVLPALVYVGVARRNPLALWLGVLLLVVGLAPAAGAALRLGPSPFAMQAALPVLLVAVVGAAWLARSAGDARHRVAALLVVGLLASVPWTFRALPDYPYQGLERPFHDALTTGESQEGALTVDGAVVGYVDERDMADAVLDRVTDGDVVLTDPGQTFAVVLLTGRPALFADAARAGDDDPPADYLLLSRDTARDRLAARLPDAASGLDPRLPVVHANDRYVLLELPDGTTP
ncbi:hypothetical protein GCM10023340_12540 [Nocardioides marinquilinus]|uniref:Glycosyltransferase RgtA/B/C/D-like domain-containing protein n=1 Tax=Nocardioides marinquilinus TaxID=1210400 RepID=A0ABP9PD18_9ACTN